MHRVFFLLGASVAFLSEIAVAAKLPAEALTRLRADFAETGAVGKLAGKWESRESQTSARVCLWLEFLGDPGTLAAVAAQALRDFIGEKTPLKDLAKSGKAVEGAKQLKTPEGPLAFYTSLAKSVPPDQIRGRVVAHWYRTFLHQTEVDPKKISRWVTRWIALHNYTLTLAEWLETENYLGVKTADAPGAPGPFACPESAFPLPPSASLKGATLSAVLSSTTAEGIRELEVMGKLGIDVALVPWRERLRPETLSALVHAREKLRERHQPAPRLGLLYDFPPEGRTAPEFPIAVRAFFSYIPPDHRARFDGRPLVFLAEPPEDVPVSEKWGAALEEKSPADFGAIPFLIKPRDRLVARLKTDSPQPYVAGIISRDHNLREALSQMVSLGDFTDLYGKDHGTYGTEVFKKVLGRFPDNSRISGFINQPNIFNIAQPLVNSGEAAELMVARWMKYYGGELTPIAEVRGRPAVKDLTSRILSGRRDLDVLAEMLASEFFYTVNDHLPEAFVDDLYAKVVARCPTESERKAAINRIQKDDNRKGVTDDLLFGDESSRTFVGLWNEFYLGRGFGPASGVYDTGASRCPLFPEVATLSAGGKQGAASFYEMSWKRALARSPRSPLIFLENASAILKHPKLAAMTGTYAGRYHSKNH